MPQISGGRRTARRVLNIQEGIAQLETRRTIMLETAPNKTGIRSYAGWTQLPELFRVVKKEPDSQEGTKARGRCRSGGRVVEGENGGGWSGKRPSPPEATREIPFHALGARGKCRACRAKFDIMHKSSAIRARISTVVIIVRASLCLPHTSAIFLRCVTFCDVASRYILYFRDTFYFKTACLLPHMVLG